MTDLCPACKKDHEYTENGVTYSAIIGVEILGLYDGICYWQCPDCGHRWPRFEGQGRVNDYLVREGILTAPSSTSGCALAGYLVPEGGIK